MEDVQNKNDGKFAPSIDKVIPKVEREVKSHFSLRTFMPSSMTSVRKDKNEPARFLGDGVSFKAKLIGILEVSEARGDRMCQEALADLKMAIRAAGEHKQRININIAIDGLRLRDEKSGDCLYHHPVHKISFIAQDMTDSRAFGYIFGSPDTGHRFFGIKTDKAAGQVVITMRDLFQVVFELKKKEIEMAKQHIEQHQIKYSSSLFSDSSSKASVEPMKMRPIAEDRYKEGASAVENESREHIMDLLDLELELNNIQQGINQMERITPSDPFGPPALPKLSSDPFGDSFNPIQHKGKLPPPPESGKRSRTSSEKHWFDQETEALFEETELPTSLSSLHSTSHQVFAQTSSGTNITSQTSSEEQRKLNDSPLLKDQFDVFTDLDPLGTGRSKPYVDKKDFFQDLKNPPKKVLKDLVGENPLDCKPLSFTADSDSEKTTNTQTNLLSDTVPISQVIGQAFPDPFQEDPFDKDPFSEVDFSRSVFTPISNVDPFEKFADFASFNPKSDSISNEIPRKKSPVPTEDSPKPTPLRVSLPPEKLSSNDAIYASPTFSRKSKLQKTNSVTGVIKLPSPKQKSRSKIHSQTSVDGFGEKNSPVMEGVTLRNKGSTFLSPSSSSSGPSVNEPPAPEPPPRYAMSSMSMKPPPLPPKKTPSSISKPPPRPPNSDYDYIENYRSTNYSDVNSPPLPAPARKPKVNLKPTPEPEYYLQPFLLLPPPKKKETLSVSVSNFTEVKATPPAHKSLDITLSQLTKTGFCDLAATLNMSPTSLSKMTLQDLTKHLASLSGEGSKEEKINTESKSIPVSTGKYSTLKESIDEDTSSFTAEFEAHFSINNGFPSQTDKEESLFDKYAVFRELLEEEKNQTENVTEESQPAISEDTDEANVTNTVSDKNHLTEDSPYIPPLEDKYAALRDICLDDVVEEKSELDLSDKEDSIVEPSRMEEDTDLLSQSRPQSESTESPTVTMKEHQSIMETTIMEEDISNLEVDEDVGDESVDDTLRETMCPTPIQMEDASPSSQNRSVHEKKSFTPTEDFKQSVDSKVSSNNSSGSASWAKFDSGNVTVIENAASVHSEGHVSPWSNESKDNDLSPACRDKRKHRKTRRHKHNQWPEDEESEEGWDARMESSSWSPSWRENGWSDGDSLYDETPPYLERDYPSPRRGRRRRVSPWNSRDQSPWEEEDREINDDHWDNTPRWTDEPRPRSKHRGPPWDEERRRHYEDPRKPRKPMGWGSDIDRKSSRESLTWEDEDRYQKRNYMERRRRKWEDDNHARERRGWREREWGEPGMKIAPRYYRDRSHESHWDDEYSEHGDDESNRWSQRPRSCDRGRRQYSSHHSSESDFNDRRYIRTRDVHFPDLDYRRKAQTLQSQKSRRKHGSQTSPFEDDFSTHFSFSKETPSPSGGMADSFESDHKQTPSLESHKKTFTESPSTKEFQEPTLSNESMNCKGYRSYQQSPFEDDFTPPDTRRCSGRSASSDLSDPKGSDEVFYTQKELKSAKSEIIKRPKSANTVDNTTSNSRTTRNINHPPEGESDNLSRSYSRIEAEHGEVPIPHRSLESKHSSDFKSRMSNLKQNDSSLRKSESVNIFARNKDPFDDDFFCEDSSNIQHKDKSSKNVSSESIKWTEAFNAFSFDEEIK